MKSHRRLGSKRSIVIGSGRGRTTHRRDAKLVRQTRFSRRVLSFPDESAPCHPAPVARLRGRRRNRQLRGGRAANACHAVGLEPPGQGTRTRHGGTGVRPQHALDHALDRRRRVLSARAQAARRPDAGARRHPGPRAEKARHGAHRLHAALCLHHAAGVDPAVPKALSGDHRLCARLAQSAGARARAQRRGRPGHRAAAKHAARTGAGAALARPSVVHLPAGPSDGGSRERAMGAGAEAALREPHARLHPATAGRSLQAFGFAGVATGARGLVHHDRLRHGAVGPRGDRPAGQVAATDRALRPGRAAAGGAGDPPRARAFREARAHPVAGGPQLQGFPARRDVNRLAPRPWGHRAARSQGGRALGSISGKTE
ncbi:hypothetical protein VARIO8X_160044 [Burkholderiales bacterium 8X]|nr:hypothetical protein VARIO8X_160044 [Burkholderiales bacterium 8X]